MKSTPIPTQRPPPPVLYFSQADLDLARRRQRLNQFQQTKGNPRAAVEATIGAIKRPFHNHSLPVRGKIRALSMIIGAATMVNLRRITRYQNQIGSQTNNQPPLQCLIDLLTRTLPTLISLLW